MENQDHKIKISLDDQQSGDFTVAKSEIESALGASLSDSRVVQLLCQVFFSIKKSQVARSLQLRDRDDRDICPICKKEFFPSTKIKKTCSNRCRRILYIRKKKGIAPSGEV